MRTRLWPVVLVFLTAFALSSCARDTDSSSPSTDGPPAAPATSDGVPTPSESVEPRGAVGPTIAPTAELTRPSFPLQLDPTGSHLVDADGDPFLIHGDAAWSLIVQLDGDQTSRYLAARRDQGFNTLVVNLIEHRFADDPPRDEAGREPFLAPGDFSRPNDAYFDAAVDQVRQAADEGFMVLLAPAYLGVNGDAEGWYQEVLAAGEEAMEDYGRYVGEKFADADNVIWLHAGDFSPPPEGQRLVEAVERGLAQAGAEQLRTAHASPGESGTDIGLDIALDIDTTYTYGLTYAASRENHTDGFDIPHFLFETAYEEDRLDRTRQELRAQAYGGLLSGAVGQVYGHGSIWQFLPDWADALDAPGAQDQVHVRALFERLPWHLLEPDIDETVVVEGAGTYFEPDFAVAAATADRRIAVVYVPEVRSLEVDLRQEPTGAAVQWFDPVAGTTVDADAELTSSGLRATPPGPNAGGDGDWLLLVDLNSDSSSAAGPLRLGGDERIATAAVVSQFLQDTADAVVLATANDFPDALVSAPLATAQEAALLLSNPSAVPQVTIDEIRRLDAEHVLVVGGPAAISPAVVDSLRQRGLDVERVNGPDRFSTAVAAAERLGGAPEVVVLASGYAFPDALTGAALASGLGGALLLTDGRTVTAATAKLIGTAEVLVIGGPAVIDDIVLEELREQGATVGRLGGQDRYVTGALAADEAIARTGSPTSAWIATGRDFPDALVTAAAAARDDGVVLLTDGRADTVPDATASALRSLAVCQAQVRLVGGSEAMSLAQEAAITDVLDC